MANDEGLSPVQLLVSRSEKADAAVRSQESVVRNARIQLENAEALLGIYQEQAAAYRRAVELLQKAEQA